MYEQEYRQYRTGCSRLGHVPLDEAAFVVRWQEFEAHAERLKVAEESGQPPDVDATLRLDMQQRVDNDPFIRAVLIGIAEDQDHEQKLR